MKTVGELIVLFNDEMRKRGIPCKCTYSDFLKANSLYSLFEETLKGHFGYGNFFKDGLFYLKQDNDQIIKQAFQKVDKLLLRKKLQEI